MAPSPGNVVNVTSRAPRRSTRRSSISSALAPAVLNVRTATATLYGIAAEELDPETLALVDHDFEVSIVVRAVRS